MWLPPGCSFQHSFEVISDVIYAKIITTNVTDCFMFFGLMISREVLAYFGVNFTSLWNTGHVTFSLLNEPNRKDNTIKVNFVYISELLTIF